MSNWLMQYVRAIKNGEIIVGRELEKLLDTLITDLDSELYSYNTAEAEFRIEFIETFCKHTKSPFNGKPFILELWQKAFIEVVYSFKDKETGYRRFKKIILLIARKNGKSTLCAALALTDFIIGNGGTDIICSSNDDAQANIIFDEINNMREMFDPHGKRTHKNMKGMFNKRNKSTIKKISDKTKNKEGRNIDLGILDESHEMQFNIIGKSIEQSQSTKDEPLFINITTEGFVNDGYLDQELIYARRVLDGEYEDPTILPWLYTQDSEVEIYEDENNWYKANPSLGTVKKHHYLRGELRKAKVSKADRVFTLSKDFNFKQNNAEAWLTVDEFTNLETFKLEEFMGCVAIGGVDLSETTDLCNAKILLMKKGDSTKYIHTMYFIPESKIELGSEEDKKNYLEWARQGLLVVCPGNENDYSKITEWFVSLYKQYKIKVFTTGYDNWNAKYWIKEMRSYGYETERVVMKVEVMSNPMKLVEADLKSKYIVYNDHPIDKWCLGNTSMKINDLGQIMPVKVQDQKNRRIDGAVTLIILYVMYNRYRSEFMNYLR